MKKSRKKLCIIALAVSACMTAPIALFACGYNADDDGSQTCTVKFDAGWGTVYGDRFYEKTVAVNSTIVQPEDPVHINDGYLFLGWNISGNDWDTMWNFDTDRIEYDITLKAVWAEAVTVTFDADGGTFDNGKQTYFVTVAKGSKLTAPEVTPPDTDQKLRMWSGGHEAWDFSFNTVVQDITLTAIWDLKDDIEAALAPYKYTRSDDGYRITGLKDNTVFGTLTIPSIVTIIDNDAFMGCKYLVSVILHDGVTDIGYRAFSGCEKLKNVTLPSGLKSIPQSTFEGCAALEQIDLPDTLTELGYSAFSGCKSLKSIELPIGVTEVYNSTFKGCENLKTVKLGINVSKIGEYAFSDCKSLEAFEIPAFVDKLGSCAFYGCSSLKSILIPVTCKEIGFRAFSYCTKLMVAELYCETVGSYAFDGCSSLSIVTIGDEVRKIGECAFYNCAMLTKIEIPDNVTDLGADAFLNCTALRSVKVGDGVSKIDSYTFLSCKALRDVSLGSGVKNIGDGAFWGCTSLLSFTIPSGVETVGSNAFYGCERLVEIYTLSAAPISGVGISTNVTRHIDASAESIIHKVNNGFSFCTFPDSVYPYEQKSFLLDYSGDSENLVLPDNYDGDSYKIFKYALAFNPQLKSVKFSAGVAGINNEILLGCDSVTELTVDSGNPWLTSADNCVISTAEKKFVLGCKTSVIPTDGSVTTIGGNVFCHNATIVNDNFNIPDSVTKIARGAFDGCDGIMRTVGHVRYVDDWAVMFEDYSGSDSLDLELRSGTVGIADSAFSSTTVYAVRLHISSVKFNDELRYVGAQAFYECGLTKVILNDGLLAIGELAFASCHNIQSTVIPDSVVEIGPAAFMGCSGIEYIKLPAELTVITRQLVCGCYSLRSIVIPSSVIKIEHSVFSDCPSAVEIYYCGSESEWNAIRIDQSGNPLLLNMTKYYYSETEIENGWHYDEDGNPTTEY